MERIERQLSAKEARLAADLISLEQDGDSAAFRAMLDFFSGEDSFFVEDTGLVSGKPKVTVSHWQ
ncbi:MAG: hypothetical protein ABH807_00420 [Candidatus Shapirobacteria bacterium]